MGIRRVDFGMLGDSKPEKIVIFRALQLGDLLCAVPAFRALRAALPAAEITLVGLPWAREFVGRYHRYLDFFEEFPGLPGFPERKPDIKAFPEFLRRLQGKRYDLALQMQGSGSLSNTLVVLFGARTTAGFYLPGQYCPDPVHFLVYPAFVHEIHRHLRLMEYLGCPDMADDLEFPLETRDEAAYQSLCEAWDLVPGSYVSIHPGARSGTRRWPPGKFAAVANCLAARGLRIVLTGTEAEKPLTQAVAGRMDQRPLDLAGQTDLGCLAHLLVGSRLLISNDTGVSHLAAALKVPSIVLFMASDPSRWAPLNRSLHRTIRWGFSAGVETVLNEAEDLLAGEKSLRG
jgi:ADP-heptose:LPS heptosyltransferase